MQAYSCMVTYHKVHEELQLLKAFVEMAAFISLY